MYWLPILRTTCGVISSFIFSQYDIMTEVGIVSTVNYCFLDFSVVYFLIKSGKDYVSMVLLCDKSDTDNFMLVLLSVRVYLTVYSAFIYTTLLDFLFTFIKNLRLVLSITKWVISSYDVIFMLMLSVFASLLINE